MTETKVAHTPGQKIPSWYIKANGDDTRFTLEDAEGSIYMRGHFGGVDYPCAPTLNLIAAAPELLKVAKRHVEFCALHKCPTCEMAEAAISKAEGTK